MSSVIVAVVVIVAISFLTFYGYISLDIGIVSTAILAVLSLFVPNLIDYSLKPKVGLQIGNLEFVKKMHDGIEGHQLKGVIMNNGKKICLNLGASVKIEDRQGKSPNLLHIRFDRKDGQETVESKEEPMRDIGYIWTIDNEHVTTAIWKELRQKDSVNLLFPHEQVSVHVGSSGLWSVYLLKLEHNTEYNVIMEVKGEDYEKNTVVKGKIAKIRLPQ